MDGMMDGWTIKTKFLQIESGQNDTKLHKEKTKQNKMAGQNGCRPMMLQHSATW